MGEIDIKSAAEELISSGEFIKTDAQSLAEGPFDAKESSVLVDGNITSGALVKGKQSVVVEGWVVGNQRSPCRIEVDGHVVVAGDAKYAAHQGAEYSHRRRGKALSAECPNGCGDRI